MVFLYIQLTFLFVSVWTDCSIIGVRCTRWVGQLGYWAYETGHKFDPILLVSPLWHNNLFICYYKPTSKEYF